MKKKENIVIQRDSLYFSGRIIVRTMILTDLYVQRNLQYCEIHSVWCENGVHTIIVVLDDTESIISIVIWLAQKLLY